MTKSIIIPLMVILEAVSCTILCAQPESVFFVKKKTELEGVSNIRRIAQDGYGFLWIATQDGMFRYDSKSVITYNTNQNTSKSIESSDVRDILIDSVNHLCWFISSGGHLYGINLETGSITNRASLQFSENNAPIFFHRIKKYNNSLVLASNKGVWLYNTTQNKFSQLKVNGSYDGDIDDIVIKDDNLIIFTKKQGILQYNFRAKKIVTVIKSNELLKGTEIRFFEALVYENNIYCGTEDGLLRLVFQNEKLKVDSNYFSFIAAQLNTKIAGLCFDRKGMLWFSNETQVIKADLANKKTEVVKSTKSEDGDWLTSVFNIFCDKNNNIWLGSQSGVAFLKNADIVFQSFVGYSKNNSHISHAYYIWPNTDSACYVCGENGLFYSNITSGDILLIDGTKAYDYIFKDPNNRLIVSNTDGLFEFNNNQFRPVGAIYKEFLKFGQVRINSCVKSGDTSLIFGTENYKGILEWNYKKKTVSNYNTASVDIKLNENVTNNLKKDGEHNIFLLGDSYLGVIDMLTKRYHVNDLQRKDKKKASLFFDLCKINRNYYVAAYGFGVLILNEKLQVVDKLSSDNGLTNNGVYKLLPWKDSLLFITTNNGLNVYNIKSKKIRAYYESDGLHSSQFEETSGNFFNDKIYAGGKNGFTVIYPFNLKENLLEPSFFYGKISVETKGSNSIDTFNIEALKFYIPNNAIQTIINFHAINYSNSDRVGFSVSYKRAE